MILCLMAHCAHDPTSTGAGRLKLGDWVSRLFHSLAPAAFPAGKQKVICFQSFPSFFLVEKIFSPP